MLTAYQAADRARSSARDASAKSLGTGLAGHFLCKLKEKQGRNRCFPGRNTCLLVESRGELISILQDLIRLYYSPSFSFISSLQARGAEGQTLSPFFLSVLSPLSLLIRAGHKFDFTPPFSHMVCCCCYFSAMFFLSKTLSLKSVMIPESH